MLQTKFKIKETETGWIEICEFINPEAGCRICDEQSGARLYFIPKYAVVKRDRVFGNVDYTESLTFEEAYEKYPWFFQD